MGYPDYQIDIDTPKSYLTRSEILNFLNNYCKNFNLRQYIKVNLVLFKILLHFLLNEN